jgi:hypothetical protein
MSDIVGFTLGLYELEKSSQFKDSTGNFKIGSSHCAMQAVHEFTSPEKCVICLIQRCIQDT